MNALVRLDTTPMDEVLFIADDSEVSRLLAHSDPCTSLEECRETYVLEHFRSRLRKGWKLAYRLVHWIDNEEIPAPMLCPSKEEEAACICHEDSMERKNRVVFWYEGMGKNAPGVGCGIVYSTLVVPE